MPITVAALARCADSKPPNDQPTTRGTASTPPATPACWRISYTAVSQAIALVQVAAIVTGHVAGVVAAHDRAVGLFPPGDTARAQYRLVTVMVLYTIGGIALLIGA